MLAVRGRHEFALPARPQARFPHRAMHPIATNLDPLRAHRVHNGPAAIAGTAGGKGRPDMGLLAQLRRARLCPQTRVIASSADTKHPACIADADRLHLQRTHRVIDHLSSRAKKAEAFIRIRLSSRSRRFFSSSCRMRCCSAVNGLPIPGPPASSASYCATQRRTAVSPKSMVRQTSPTDNPWSLMARPQA